MATIVIYHASCTDGFTAAWCTWLKFRDSAEYLPAHYGDEPPDVTGKDVLILDFSYPRATLLDMELQRPKSLLILDHHKTAEAELRGLNFAKFDMARSGAAMAWDELHGGARPKIVDYVQDRDLWHWSLPKSREISAYIASFGFHFDLWDHMRVCIEQDVQRCAREGEAILRAQDKHVGFMAQNAGKALIGGHVVPFINTTTLQSEIVGALAETATFACGWFQRADGKFVYSLRSRGDFDVSAVAKSRGGGGHKNAAGFTLDYLIPMESN